MLDLTKERDVHIDQRLRSHGPGLVPVGWQDHFDLQSARQSENPQPAQQSQRELGLGWYQ